MKEAGFNVRKWKSSSKRLMEWIDEKDGVPIKEMVKLSREKSPHAQTQSGLQGCSESVSGEKKILGLNWNIERDTFVFRFDWLVEFAKELSLFWNLTQRVDVNINCACYMKFQGTSLSCLNNWLSSQKITDLTTWQSVFQALLSNGLLPKTTIHLEHVSVPLQHKSPTLREAGLHLKLNQKCWYG